MEWEINDSVSLERLNRLSEELNVDAFILNIFLNRINSANSARIFFKDYDETIIKPELLKNANEIARIIAQFILTGDIIIVNGDYDSDGINATHIMFNVINDLANKLQTGVTVNYFLPDRDHGYGLSMLFADTVLDIECNNSKKLVITVDNGIAQVEQINKLVDNGVTVVVTDHHESKDKVPNCLICDPHNHHVEQDDTFKHLCGAGIALKVCELIQKFFGDYDVYKYVANVAIATITDVMPFTSENLSLIKYGVDILNSEDCPVGIKAMKDYLGIKRLTPSHIAWEIGPRLNACGRMNNTNLAGYLLNETDYDKAVDLVNEIEIINDTRKEITSKAMEQTNEMNFDDDEICIVELEEIPHGIVGIIAGKVSEKFNKPSIVVTGKDGILSGSARSIPGINLQTLFKEELRNGNLINFGGHAEAAGITIDETKVDDLRKSLNNSISKIEITKLSEEEDQVLILDDIILLENINEEVFNLINQLPYNNTNFKKPVFAICGCKVKDAMPTRNNPENLWLTLKQGRTTMKLWCKGMTSIYRNLGSPRIINIAGFVEKNFIQGGTPYTFNVIDIMEGEE